MTSHNTSCCGGKPRLEQLIRPIAIQRQALWQAQSAQHQAIVVTPAYCLEQEELEKAVGVDYYEERAIWTTCLSQDGVKVIFVSSSELSNAARTHLVSRLPPRVIGAGSVVFVSVGDRTPGLCLAERIALRPDVLAKIKSEIGNRSAWLMPYLARDQDFAIGDLLGIPVEGALPALQYWGTKSGSRKIFAEAGVDHPHGYVDLASESDIIEAIAQIWLKEPSPKAVLVKINAGVSGFGILKIDLPQPAPRFGRKEFLQSQLESAAGGREQLDKFLDRFAKHQGIVEAFVSGKVSSSPSGQAYISATNKVSIIASHEQILGGGGQVYLGASFPAKHSYREEVHQATRRVGEILASKGALGYFSVDFVVADGVPYAVEINLRQVGTLHYFNSASYLRQAKFDEATGRLVDINGKEVCYIGSDNLKYASLKGTKPEALLSILESKGLLFDNKTGEGCVLHLLGLVEPYGKVGATTIASSTDRAAASHTELESTLSQIKSKK